MRYLKHILISIFVLICAFAARSQDNSLLVLNQPKLYQLYESGMYTILDEKCDRIIENSDDDLAIASAYTFKSLTNSNFGYFGKALMFIKEAESLFRRVKYQNGISLCALKKAAVLLLMNDKMDAKETLSKASASINKSNNTSLLIELLELEALILASEDLHHEAIEKQKKALQLLTSKQLLKNIKSISLLDQLGSNYYSLGILDSAILYYEQLIDNYNLEPYSAKLNTLSTISELFVQKGDYKEAIEHLITAEQIAVENSDTIFLQNLNTQISSLFLEQKQWNKVLEYSNRALELLENSSNLLLLANNYYYKGQAYFQTKEPEIAEVALTKTLKQFSALENYSKISDVLITMADYGMPFLEIEGIREGVEDAMKIHIKSGDELSQIKSKLVIAQLDWSDKDYFSAKGTLEEVLSLSEHSENMPVQETAHLMLSKLNSEMGNHQKAYSHAQSYHRIYDQLRSDAVNERINRLNIEFETEKTAQELENERLITTNQQELLKRKNLQNVLLMIAFIFVFMIASGLYLLKVKNKQLQKQKLATFDKEKETAILKAELKGESLERARVARELHDGLGTVLATVKMQMNGIQNTYPQVTDVDAYQKAESLIDNACKSVREISHDMMPTVIQDQGLDQAIETLCNTINSREELHIDYIPYQVDLLNNKELEFNVYRIIQELLKNILKHAEAKEVIVQITNEDNLLSITVEDDGNGFNIEDKKEGIGFENIKFRVRNQNGKLEISSILHKGSTIHISLPIL